jgi:hypothetical protein
MASATMSRKLIEDLVFGTGRVRRFTQDSPVLPDVWLEYAVAHVGQGDADDERRTKKTDDRDPHPPVRLLLTPHGETNTGVIAQKLRHRLTSERRKPEWALSSTRSRPWRPSCISRTSFAWCCR